MKPKAKLWKKTEQGKTLEHKKYRFAGGAGGKAKFLLADALDNIGNCVLAITLLLAIGAAMHFTGIELFQPAFAELPSVPQPADSASTNHVPAGNSYYRSMSESLSVIASHGSGSNTNIPASYHRSMSEPMSVTTTQGKAPNSFSRSMSEQVSLTTGMPSSSPSSTLATQPQRNAPATYSPSSNNRIDERLSPTLKILGKKDGTTAKSIIGDAPYLVAESLGSMHAGSSDQYSETIEISGEDANPNDSSAFPRQLDALNEYMLMQKSIQNAVMLQASVSAVFLIGTFAVAVGNQPAVRSGRIQKKMYALFLLRHRVVPNGNETSKKIGNPQVTYVLLLVLVIFTVSSIVNVVDPLAGQAFAAIMYVGVGTAVTGNGDGNLTPGLPSGLQTGDMMVVYYYTRGTGGSVSISAGWTLLYDHSDSGGRIAVWYRFYQNGDGAPTITSSGLISTGPPGSRDDTIAQVAVWRGVSTGDPIDALGTVSTNGSQQNIGAISGITIAADSVVIVLGGKRDDWTSVVTLSGDSLTWAEIGERYSTAGADAGMVWDYAINGAVQNTITSKTFTVTGGASAAGKGVMFSLRTQNFQANPSDMMGLTDGITAKVTLRAVADSLSIADTISTDVNKLVVDYIVITETITTSVAKVLTEQLSIQDTIARTVTRSVSMTEQLTVTDTLARSITFARTMTEQSAMTETIAKFVSKPLSEQLGVSDSLQRLVTTTRTLSEQLTVEETITKAVTMILTEQLTLTESAARSVIITRTVSDSLTLSDTTSGTPAVFVIITESMLIDDSFVNIALLVHLDLGEPLVLVQSFATNFSASFNQLHSEGIIIGDGVVLSLEPSGQVFNRNITESIEIQDSLIMLLMIPPPPTPPVITTMPNLMMTETEDLDAFDGLADPMKAVELDGLWNLDSLDEQGLQSLLNATGMPVYDVDLEAVSDDIDDLTMILPTFEVSVNIGGQTSDDGIFLTPTLSKFPAGMQVIVPIDVQASMNGTGNLDHLGSVIVTFTPAESADNFTMLITMLDNTPEDIVGGLPADIAAFYIDVSIVGDFGVITPDNSAFFEEQPEVTFTITEEWPQAQDTERDSNNVPIIGLFLLDEITGDWIEMSSDEIEAPTSAVDDVYTYSAILPHFSTYVVTADENRVSGGGRSSSEFTRSLTESLFVTSAMNIGSPIGSEGKIIIKDIVDSLTLRAEQPQPLHQRVITINDVTVAVSIADVRSATFGTAIATLNFEIINKGSTAEELVLRFWYSDSAEGEMVYEAEQTITVGAGESILEEVKIPFSSSGLYNVMIEVESDDGTLSTTDIAVNVPWLTVYLYILIVIAIAVVLASIAYVIYAMRRSGLSVVGDK